MRGAAFPASIPCRKIIYLWQRPALGSETNPPEVPFSLHQLLRVQTSRQLARCQIVGELQLFQDEPDPLSFPGLPFIFGVLCSPQHSHVE